MESGEATPWARDPVNEAESRGRAEGDWWSGKSPVILLRQSTYVLVPRQRYGTVTASPNGAPLMRGQKERRTDGQQDGGRYHDQERSKPTIYDACVPTWPPGQVGLLQVKAVDEQFCHFNPCSAGKR